MGYRCVVKVGREEPCVVIVRRGSRLIAKQARNRNDRRPRLYGERRCGVVQVVRRDRQAQGSRSRIEAVAAKIAVSQRRGVRGGKTSSEAPDCAWRPSNVKPEPPADSIAVMVSCAPWRSCRWCAPTRAPFSAQSDSGASTDPAAGPCHQGDFPVSRDICRVLSFAIFSF
jgi:hypothetical protein